MLRIVSRIMENGVVIGYTLSDGSNQQNLSKDEVWALAKANQIQFVKAVSNSPDKGITGTDGFELRKLPTEQIDTNIEACVYTAALHRHMEKVLYLKNNNLNQDDPKFIEFRKKAVEEELASGVLNRLSFHKDSGSLRLTGLIGITKPSKIAALMAQASEQEKVALRKIVINRKETEKVSKLLNTLLKRHLEKSEDGIFNNFEVGVASISDDIIGYVFKNTGNSPIQYEIVDMNTHNISYGTINPGQEAHLSRVETVLLLRKPTINFKISNATLLASTFKEKTYWEQIARCYMAYNNVEERKAAKRVFLYDLDAKDISRFLNRDKEIEFMTRLIGSNLTDDEMRIYINASEGSTGDKSTPSNNRTNTRETSNALAQAKGLKGVLNAFKR